MLQRRTPLKRGGPLNKVGKRKKLETSKTAKIRNVYLVAHPRCEIGAILLQHQVAASQYCTIKATCIHERQKRSQGGSLTDTDNLMASCYFCNGWIEDHPAMARSFGLVVHAHENPSEIPLNR